MVLAATWLDGRKGPPASVAHGHMDSKASSCHTCNND